VVTAAIVLPRLFGGSGEPEETMLFGQTSRGAGVSLTLVDGKLRTVQTNPAAWCPQQTTWIDWRWVAQDGQRRVEIEQDDSRFAVEERENVDATPFTTLVVSMRGELGENGASARGSIRARATGEQATCEGTVRFSARRTP
jgi:hypothetical protein